MFVGWCSWFVVVVCCVLLGEVRFAVGCPYVLFVVCCLMFVVWCASDVVCCLWL